MLIPDRSVVGVDFFTDTAPLDLDTSLGDAPRLTRASAAAFGAAFEDAFGPAFDVVLEAVFAAFFDGRAFETPPRAALAPTFGGLLFAASFEVFAATFEVFTATFEVFTATFEVFAATFEVFDATFEVFDATFELFAATFEVFAATLGCVFEARGPEAAEAFEAPRRPVVLRPVTRTILRAARLDSYLTTR
ncbi:MAG: hypothetical protein IPK13_13745 [Deltaproteobacteria bacterium]|nr:hypothetical protein [Deltaproteobacteria bacterium]